MCELLEWELLEWELLEWELLELSSDTQSYAIRRQLPLRTPVGCL
jgi:hypothetical protein